MARHERTKHLLANTLMDMAKDTPIQKIQVKDICSACHVERTTFYYHFHDKYELIAWIFSQFYEREAARADSPNSKAMITRMLQHLENHRDFFLNALEDPSQNNLRQYMLDFYIEYERKAVCRYLMITELDEKTDYILRHYSFGCMGNTIDWLLGKTHYTPERLAQYQYQAMPDVLKLAWSQRC